MPVITHIKGRKAHTDRKSIVTRKCKRCGAEFSAYDDVHSLRCPTCSSKGDISANNLLTYKRIEGEKVDEIKSREIIQDDSDVAKVGSFNDLWDIGKIQTNIHKIVKPISGIGQLKIIGRANKQAWLNKVVKINDGWYRLSDIGAALKEML